MADVIKTNARKLPDPQFGGVPYGNASKLHYVFETNSSGVMVDSDTTTAVAAADVVVLGVLPAGMKLMDCLTIISDASTATITGDIGFRYVDGVDSTVVPQDADYFNASLDLATAARAVAANTAVKPVTLPKDAYFTLTSKVAAHASACRIDFLVEGVMRGND